tara:strand:- start:2774 stop:3154 length:381 start_codon:yes stop_codon:yes gene_type:complete
MSTIINGTRQSQVEDLNTLSSELYENIFNVNLVDNRDSNFYFYNLLNKVSFPDNISDEFIDEITLISDKPWTTLSYELYGTIQLWWSIYLLNKPDYIFKAQANRPYKYIKSGALPRVLEQLRSNQS